MPATSPDYSSAAELHIVHLLARCPNLLSLLVFNFGAWIIVAKGIQRERERERERERDAMSNSTMHEKSA
jgi:hypothetical protein